MNLPAGPRFVPSPTVEQFIYAVLEGPPNEWRLLILMGARSEGKTTGTIMACAALAEDLRLKGFKGFPIVVAFVRDTWENLKRTTLPSFRENRAKGLPIEMFDGGKQATFGPQDAPWVHFWFFGLDRAEDADKLQGFSCAILVLEEVAPAAGIATGVPPEALGIGATSLKQPGVPKRILLPMNPPDDDHWVLKVEKYLAQAGLDFVRVHRFEMAEGEKSAHFERLAAMTQGEEAQGWQLAADEFDAYRQANRAFLESIGRGDLVQRLVHGQVGFAQTGEAVVPNFSRVLHVAKEPLQVYRNLPILRGFDSGAGDLHPACVWVQAAHALGVNVLASRVAENVGIEEFITEQVLPLQRKYGWLVPSAGTSFGPPARAGFTFRNLGDPACLDMSGISSQLTVAKVIQNRLGGGFEPGPQDWDSRRQALLAAFERPGKRNRPRFVQIDPEENEVLIKALSGRFHYGKDLATGRINGTIENAKRLSGIYCVDDETEILTVSGWKRHDSLEKGENVFTWRGGKLVASPLLDIHRFPGPHRMLEFSHSNLSMVVSEDHRCLIRHWYANGVVQRPLPPEFKRAIELRPSDRIVRTGTVARRPTLSTALVRLCAWVAAEGSFHDGQTIRLFQSQRVNPEYCHAIQGLCAGSSDIVQLSANEGMTQWRIAGNTAALIRLLMPEKIPGSEFWNRLSPTQARVFLYEFARGDGHWSRQPDTARPEPPARFWRSMKNFFLDSTVRIHQNDERRIDALQIIAVLGGMSGRTLARDARGRWGLSLSNHRALTSVARLVRQPVTVSGGAWCPETADHTWVARRRGSVFVTGNSHPVMGLAYILAVEFPAEDWGRSPERPTMPASVRLPAKSWLGT